MALVGLGVSGGIGAYKAVEIVRLLQKRGHDVQTVMTRAARRFVGPLTFEAITHKPVITSQFAPGLNADIEHIALASTMELLIVAPATANVIGKFAHGIADDFLSSLYLATRALVLVAPAMNTQMWEHPAVRANVDTLGARGVHFVDPGEGYLACGWVGRGRLAEPPEIVEAALRLLARRSTPGRLAGRRVLVTAGPTFEDLDPIRFIGNRSSGRMGFAVAAEAQARGADVILVAGPTSLEPPPVAQVIRTRSARQMHDVVMRESAEVDAVIMAAAVADYTAAGGAAARKIEKGGPLTLTLERTPDILAELGARRGDDPLPVLVGFAAETGDPSARAAKKLTAKRADLIVANDVSAEGSGFEVSTNQVTLISEAGAEPLPLMAKSEVAVAILDRVEALLLRQPAPLR
jgi:phosphopantothenoylcysteine decarboxylase/phosphopantothenate--cysteine ligase